MKIMISIFCLFFASAIVAKAQEGNFHLDKEYKINASGVIKLHASDAKVYITGSARTTAHVKIDREITTKGFTFGHEEFGVEVSEENGNLDIREHSSSVSVGIVGYYHEKYTINIEAPQGSSLVVKGDDGDYLIKNIDGSISLDLDDADVELAGCSGNKFDFRMDDGDLIIETSLSDHGEYHIDAQDGMVSFTVTRGGGRFNIRHDDGRVSTQGDFNIEEDSEHRTRLTLASGVANVDIRTDDARVRLIKK